MRKAIVSTLALVAFCSVAVAQDSVLVFDVRDNGASGNDAARQSLTTPAVPYINGQAVGSPATLANSPAGLPAAGLGGLGNGEILRLAPVQPTSGAHNTPGFPNFDGNANSSNGNLNLYMLVRDKGACTGDVITSVGVNFAAAPTGAGTGNPISSMSYAWASGFGWQGTAVGAPSATSVTGNKAVFVPVNTTPSYDTTGGLVPGAGSAYSLNRVGALTVQAGTRACPASVGTKANSSWGIKMSVNNLLITRGCSNGPAGDEMVSMGYASGGAGVHNPEQPPVNGSSDGAMSAVNDAVVVIQVKGDFNDTGTVTNPDVQQCVLARNAGAAIDQERLFQGDFNGVGNITNPDVQSTTNARLLSGTACPN